MSKKVDYYITQNSVNGQVNRPVRVYSNMNVTFVDDDHITPYKEEDLEKAKKVTKALNEMAKASEAEFEYKLIQRTYTEKEVDIS